MGKRQRYHTGITKRLRLLEVGDTFSLSVSDPGIKNLFVYARRLGIKIATRAKGNTLKVWRLE